jgi:hypothetical protein
MGIDRWRWQTGRAFGQQRRQATLAREEERRGPCAFLESVTIQTGRPAAEGRKLRNCGHNENCRRRTLIGHVTGRASHSCRSADPFLISTQANSIRYCRDYPAICVGCLRGRSLSSHFASTSNAVLLDAMATAPPKDSTPEGIHTSIASYKDAAPHSQALRRRNIIVPPLYFGAVAPKLYRRLDPRNMAC